MTVPTFIDLQGFDFERNFVVKEVAVLRKGTVLSHYIFTSPEPWSALNKTERRLVSWLKVKHHGLRWDDGFVPYWNAESLITTAVVDVEEDDETPSLVYVKGLQKKKWLEDMLDPNMKEDIIIKTLETDYMDIESLTKLDATNTMRCCKHNKHCALQNVFKIYNWWSRRQKKL